MRVSLDLEALDRSQPIAFVPTMGALHAGHAALITAAKEFTDHVVVSIFVNPLQFEDPSDLAKYPRSPESDAHLAEEAGASFLWIPKVQQVYPSGYLEIATPPQGEKFEGATRKGHFGGALTAVNALFTSVRPRWAIFGEKDFQQLFLVRQMARDRHRGIDVIAVETVRDSDGLALSSRNVRLSTNERDAALIISKALSKAVAKRTLSEAKFSLVKTLSQEPRFTLDYAAIIDEETFDMANEQTLKKRAIVAGWVGKVRLIDNMAMTNVEQ